jgi:hypothetical protein
MLMSIVSHDESKIYLQGCISIISECQFAND